MVRYARRCVCYVESFQMSGNIMELACVRVMMGLISMSENSINDEYVCTNCLVSTAPLFKFVSMYEVGEYVYVFFMEEAIETNPDRVSIYLCCQILHLLPPLTYI